MLGGDALDVGAQLAQALVDPLVAAVDLADVADLAAPSAHSAASSIAMPARMSGDSTRSPRSRRGPVTIARWGSQRTMSAPIRISLSVKIRRLSNIHSCTRIEPSAWVASATRDRGQIGGERGPGPVLDLALVPADVGLDDEPLAAGDDHVVAVELGAQAEPFEHEADHAQVAGDRVA